MKAQLLPAPSTQLQGKVTRPPPSGPFWAFCSHCGWSWSGRAQLSISSHVPPSAELQARLGTQPGPQQPLQHPHCCGGSRHGSVASSAGHCSLLWTLSRGASYRAPPRLSPANCLQTTPSLPFFLVPICRQSGCFRPQPAELPWAPGTTKQVEHWEEGAGPIPALP